MSGDANRGAEPQAEATRLIAAGDGARRRPGLVGVRHLSFAKPGSRSSISQRERKMPDTSGGVAVWSKPGYFLGGFARVTVGFLRGCARSPAWRTEALTKVSFMVSSRPRAEQVVMVRQGASEAFR